MRTDCTIRYNDLHMAFFWKSPFPFRAFVAMTVGKSTAHSDNLGWYILGFEICQGVPNASFGLKEWADQRMKNVNKALIEQSQPY